MMNFLASLDDDGYFRIPLEQTIQAEMSSLFQKQFDYWFSSEPDKIPFSPSHTPDDSEVAYIEAYALPGDLEAAIQAPLGQPIFSKSKLPKLKAIIGVDQEKSRRVHFQIFEKRRLLGTASLSIILSGETYSKLQLPGLTVDTKIAATWCPERLYFKSFSSARRVLPLTSYFKAATDTDLVAFGKNEAVKFESHELLLKHSDQWIRKRIAIINDSGILERVPPADIALKALEFSLKIEVGGKDGKDALLFPNDKKQIKAILRFLDEDYYRSPLTGTKYIANSKHTLEK